MRSTAVVYDFDQTFVGKGISKYCLVCF